MFLTSMYDFVNI